MEQLVKLYGMHCIYNVCPNVTLPVYRLVLSWILFSEMSPPFPAVYGLVGSRFRPRKLRHRMQQGESGDLPDGKSIFFGL